MRPLAATTLAALLLVACGDDDVSCPEGTRLAGAACVPVDAGARDMTTASDADTDGGACPACAGDQVCDADTGACVACLGDPDCADGVCLVDGADSANNACVGCRTADDCADPTPRCEPASQACVACVADADCTDPAAAECLSDFSCGGCTADAACAALTDTPVCDEPSETCVQCTADDESACGANVCDVAAGTCTTDTPAGMTGLCQPCVSDRQCSAGRVCAPMAFGGTDLGHFCLWRLDATAGGGPMGSCTNTRPYAEQAVDITTVSGATTTVCTLALTTCEALSQFRMTDCTTPFTSDDECGVTGLDDGICRARDAVVNRCTIPCLSDDDCDTGSTCNTGETPRYCNF